MSNPKPYLLAETNWKAVQATAYQVAILPWGATEAHNYHLPYATDNYQVEYIVEKAAEKAWANGSRVIVLPCIPFGIQCMKMVGLALWPFGKEVVNKPNQKSGCVYPVLTIVWILIGGIWICVEHLLLGVLFAITVVGIPFAIQHFKLAGLAIVPFGKEIRDKKKQ